LVSSAAVVKVVDPDKRPARSATFFHKLNYILQFAETYNAHLVSYAASQRHSFRISPA
jgi:hypothetical protein